MTDQGQATPQPSWQDLILAQQDPRLAWTGIFDRLRGLAIETPNPHTLHKLTVAPDRMLSESAWNLWCDFPTAAPTVVEGLKTFWCESSMSGTAVLVMDALSIRELPLIIGGARKRGIEPAKVAVMGSQVPSDTDQFAAALGLPGRSKLRNNQAPPSFAFAGPDTHTDLLDMPFEDCLGSIPPTPRVFVWHTWLDEKLIHPNEGNDTGHTIVASETKKQFGADGFWSLINRLRQGRRLVITGDHGYAVSQFFSSEVEDEASVRLLRQHFHAGRCARENPENPWPRCHLPPLVCRHNGWLVVMGQRKWKVQGGFPHLCHRGLSLLEVAVPFIELPPL